MNNPEESTKSNEMKGRTRRLSFDATIAKKARENNDNVNKQI